MTEGKAPVEEEIAITVIIDGIMNAIDPNRI